MGWWVGVLGPCARGRGALVQALALRTRTRTVGFPAASSRTRRRGSPPLRSGDCGAPPGDAQLVAPAPSANTHGCGGPEAPPIATRVPSCGRDAGPRRARGCSPLPDWVPREADPGPAPAPALGLRGSACAPGARRRRKAPGLGELRSLRGKYTSSVSVLPILKAQNKK